MYHQIVFRYIKFNSNDCVAYYFGKEDFMDKSTNTKPVGYAYVPVQRLGKVYSPNKALRVGTIFPELNITIDEYERGLFNGK